MGYNWTECPIAGSQIWATVAASSSGTYVVAATTPNASLVDGYLYTSSDSGNTWTQHIELGALAWTGAACSYDGSIMVACDHSGHIYRSTDHGATWTTLTTAGVKTWAKLSMSSDGSKIVALADGDCLYISTDNGFTWTARTGAGSPFEWIGLGISSDGSKIIVADNSGGGLQKSSDYGATWTTITTAGSESWGALACSSDGNTLVVGGISNSHIQISTDFGQTWTITSTLGSWYSASCSPDGKTIAALFTGQTFIVTTDGGLSWVSQLTNGSWSASAMSADTSTIFVGQTGGSLWKGLYVAAPATTTATPAAGTYIGPQSITLTIDKTASIYYTTDGSDPKVSGVLYSAPIAISSAMNTLKYYSVNSDGVLESTKTSSYDLIPNVTAIPPGGSYNSSQAVVLSADVSGYAIYYQINGAGSGIQYTGPITISANTTLKFFAQNSLHSSSAVTEAYTFDTTPPVTTATPPGGSYTGTQSVTLSASEPATTYYTTDGSTPTTASTIYTGPISISANTTLKFFSVDTAGNSETVKTATYTISASVYTWSRLDNSAWTYPWGTEVNHVVASDDCTHIALTGYSSSAKISSDSGATFTTGSGATGGLFYELASSSTGANLVASCGDNYVYTSSDYGNTWSKRIAVPTRVDGAVASSSDGTKLMFFDGGGYLHTSSDSGNTWTTQTQSGLNNWVAATCTPDGTKIFALSSSNTWVYINTTSGAGTWTEAVTGASGTVQSIACSSDGTKIIIGLSTGAYLSTNSGASWAAISALSGASITSLAISPDGTKIVACRSTGYLATSVDSGATWTNATTAGSQAWTSVDISSDGNKIVALYSSSGTGYAWFGTYSAPADTTPPVTTATPAGGSYTGTQSVTLSASEPATTYYTTDGTTPTAASTVYTGPISISATTTLKFFSKDTAGNSETVKTQTYTVFQGAYAALNLGSVTLDVGIGIGGNLNVGAVTADVGFGFNVGCFYVGSISVGSAFLVGQNIRAAFSVGSIATTATLNNLVPNAASGAISVGSVTLAGDIVINGAEALNLSVGSVAVAAGFNSTNIASANLRVGSVTVVGGFPTIPGDLPVGSISMVVGFNFGNVLGGDLSLGSVTTVGTLIVPIIAEGLLQVGRVTTDGTFVTSQNIFAALQVGSAQVSGVSQSGNVMFGNIQIGSISSTLDLLQSQILSAALSVGQVDVLARFSSSVSGNYEVWLINAKTLGLSTYTNYRFNSFAQFQGKVLAASDSGIYVCDAADDAGTQIEAHIETLTNDMGAETIKVANRGNVDCEGLGEIVVTAANETDDESSDTALLNYEDNQRQNRRLRFARGNKARYWRVKMDLFGQVKVASAELIADAVTKRFQ